VVGLHVLSLRLTGNHYRDFLSNDLPDVLEDVPLAVRARMWYMHISGSAHFSRAVRGIFSSTYHNRWINGGGPTAWSSSSPHFNLLDFCPWGTNQRIVKA
jgi:hypothetical protein